VCCNNFEEETIVVITAYEPTLDIWVSSFKEKKKE
jgi:frataxin-like iron-binding protein CyaY